MAKKYPKLCRHKATGAGYVRINGKQRYLSGTWHDPAKPSRQLLRSYEEFKYELDLERAGGVHQVKRLVETYETYLQGRTSRSSSSEYNNKFAIKVLRRLLRPHLEDTLELVTVQQLQLIRERLNSKGYAITTLRDYWCILMQFLKWCVSRGKTSPEIMLKASSLPNINTYEYENCKPARVREAVTWEQIQATLPHLSETLQTVLLVMLGTGARPQEVLDLRWDDINREKPVWEYEPLNHKMKSRGRHRVIYISAPIQHLLKEYQLRRLDPDAEYIFTGAESWALQMAKRAGDDPQETFEDRPDTVSERLDARRLYQAVKRICVREEIDPWTPYQCRHFFAETMLAKLSDHFKGNGSHGLAIEAVSALLGHKNIDVTQIYAKRNLALSRDLLEDVNISFSIS